MNTELIRLDNISFAYPDQTRALEEISLILKRGGRYALAGHNGAGKTTLFLLLTAILQPQSGVISLGGEPYSYKTKPLRELRRRVGLVMQNPDWQLFNPTVEREIAYGLYNLGLPQAEISRKTAAMLELFGLQEVREKPPHFLSYGQKKKVCLAAILAVEPEVLILDEPTAGLDLAQQEKLLTYLENLNGITVLIATHDLEFAYAFTSDWLILEKGRLVFNGSLPVADLIQQERFLPPVLKLEKALIKSGRIEPADQILNSTDKLINHILQKVQP